MKTLVILSSILGDASASTGLARYFIDRLRQAEPSAEIVVRNLASDPIPYFDGAVAGALFTPPEQRTPEQKRLLQLSDDLIAELMEADRIVLAVPVYNYGIPAQLKSYFDHLARAGVTFRYTENGPVGLVQGKQAVVLVARGSQALGTPLDTMTPSIKVFLNFLGIKDVTLVAAEGLKMGEALAAASLARARERIDALLPVQSEAAAA
jgi:Acyl carrier protein phosphodiesterase